jgi:ankyrin repeat protein
VKRQDAEGRHELHLSHFSVKEFLASNALQSSLPQYGFRENEAHTLIARSCIAYIFYYSFSPEKTSTEADLDLFPLLDYSCRFWFEHSTLARENHEQLTTLIIKLLRSEVAWDDCLRVYNPCRSYSRPFERRIYPNLYLPLGWTAVLGLESVAKVLLEEGTEDINANQNKDISKYLIEARLEEAERPSYFRGPFWDLGQTALMKAVFDCRENMVRLLIENGAAVDHVDPYFDTALAAACALGEIGILKALLEGGANPNGANGQRQSPLEQAASWKKKFSFCKLLLEYGADPDSHPGSQYPNPLSAAAHAAADDVVELLLEKGAKMNESIFYYALGRWRDPPGRICELLLQHGANLNPTCWPTCDRPLAIALWHGWEDTSKLMLAKGAEINPDDASCLTAGNTLQAAVIGGSIEIITLLLDKGVDVNAPAVDVMFWHFPRLNSCQEYYATPLQAAAYCLYIDATSLLLERGADVNAQGRPYGSALWAVGAAIGGDDRAPETIKLARSICALLIAHNADWKLASGFRDQETKEKCLKGLQKLMPGVAIDMD